MDKSNSGSILPGEKAGWLMIFFCLQFAMSWAMDAQKGGVASAEITHKEYCSFTRYPVLCMDTLLGTQGLVHGHVALVSLLIERTRDETIQATAIGASSFPNHTVKSAESPRTQEAIDYCDGLMQMALKRLNQSLTALKSSPQTSKPDIQTWLSAVLTFQDSCKDSFNEYSGPLISQISSKMDHLSMLASNALALANRIPGNGPARASRRLASEEKLFPKWVSSKDRKLLLSTAIQADAVVALDGSGNYTSISKALESLAGSGGRRVIYMKAGVYKGRFSVAQDNIMLVGEGKDTTVISNGASVGGGSSMPDSATVVVTGDNFVAKDIGFENSAGSGGSQAVALRIVSDHAALFRCSLRGYQDTLYATALRQFYRECDIHGTIDFIFGNAAAVFQSCNIILRKPYSGGYNTIMANGRTDPGQNTGFSVHNCKIGAGSEFYASRHSIRSYLGRPWKQYSRAVVMKSSIDDSIQSSGWVAWSGDFALSSLYFAEYLNGGPGAATSGRVQWPGFHVLGSSEASKFTVANFISGTSWLPSTGVIYDPGL